ncbi:MAG: YeeE/YedE family protein [Alphaproteobacteria bacterium]|nr:MAG: YeeE/YedE family protein [Alphaproteobacteria bacterium]
MQILVALLSGLLFGTGLTLSGMVNPAVVLGFLDVAGDWNPALLIVMVSALAVALPGFRLLEGRKPLFAPRQFVPTRSDIDMPLVLGSLIFGIGWGLAGICPGPALAMLSIEPGRAVIFIATMSAGMLAVHLIRR